MATLGRKVFVIPARDWAGGGGADALALHTRNIAALRSSLRTNGVPFRDVLSVGIEANADGASVNLIYEWTD